jgi:hypothetical protein
MDDYDTKKWNEAMCRVNNRDERDRWLTVGEAACLIAMAITGAFIWWLA